MITVSILIPAYKAEAFIARAVKSVLAQTLQDFEVIITSDDKQNYEAILKSGGIDDPRLRFTSTRKIGAGAGAARNAALKWVQSDMVAVLDADDEFMPNHLECLLPKAQQYGLAITQIELVDNNTGAVLPNQSKPHNEGLLALHDVLQACLHGHSPIMFDRRKVTHRWNEDVSLLEDAH